MRGVADEEVYRLSRNTYGGTCRNDGIISRIWVVGVIYNEPVRTWGAIDSRVSLTGRMGTGNCSRRPPLRGTEWDIVLITR